MPSESTEISSTHRMSAPSTTGKRGRPSLIDTQAPASDEENDDEDDLNNFPLSAQRRTILMFRSHVGSNFEIQLIIGKTQGRLNNKRKRQFLSFMTFRHVKVSLRLADKRKAPSLELPRPATKSSNSTKASTPSTTGKGGRPSWFDNQASASNDED